jgi:hypothetical protein
METLYLFVRAFHPLSRILLRCARNQYAAAAASGLQEQIVQYLYDFNSTVQ